MNNERPSPKIPIRLKKEPLLEAIFEIRFTGAKQSVAELLPGLIFKAMPEKYPETVRLPAADIPARILENDPNLKFVPKIRLQNQNQAIQLTFRTSQTRVDQFPGASCFFQASPKTHHCSLIFR